MKNIMQLEEFFIKKLCIVWNEPKSKAEIATETLIDYSISRHKKEKNRFCLDLRVEVGPAKKSRRAGYEIDTEIIGFFTFPRSMKEEEMQKLVPFNGTFILYGILRGEIASFSGSFPGGKFILPTVDMASVVKSIEEKKSSFRQTKRKANKKMVK